MKKIRYFDVKIKKTLSRRSALLLMFFLVLFLSSQSGCNLREDKTTAVATASSLLDKYVAQPDSSFHYEYLNTVTGDGYKAHVVRLVSQHWLTTAEVKDPFWWHWLTIVIPDSVGSSTGLLFIGGGKRTDPAPQKAEDEFVKIALATNSVVTFLHNVPNQPMEFVGDSYGPRVEDELIAYGWRQYLEAGGGDENVRWLPRLPMTNSAVRAMDAVSAVCLEKDSLVVDHYVVAGGSKRGWTTWTTAVVDHRVIAIMPIVIDMLNVVPSFQHHWQAYGFWAPAVKNYVHEGIMEWQNSQEYQSLMKNVEPYTFRNRLTLPKLLINASGDQFFLPDSWQFYWSDLVGEKYIRYVPNTDHGLHDSDALESIAAFHYMIINNKPRPNFDWSVENGRINIATDPAQPPKKILLWQAVNTKTRDFRLLAIGKTWQSQAIILRDDGQYQVSIEKPQVGWAAFFVELTYPGTADIPLKMSTGVVVVPDSLPFAPYESPAPKGTPLSEDKLLR